MLSGFKSRWTILKFSYKNFIPFTNYPKIDETKDSSTLPSCLFKNSLNVIDSS